MAAPWNVIRGSVMTCHWIRQVAAPYSAAGGSGRTCHWIRLNVRHWNSTPGCDFDQITAVDMSFCTSLRNFIQIGPHSAEKMTSYRFSRWRISAILDFRDPIMGSFKSPCTTSYRSSVETIALCLVFEKIAFFAFWRQTDRQTNWQRDESTDGQHRYTKPLSLSRAAA